MSVSYSAVAPEADVLGLTSGGKTIDTGPKFIGDAVPENMEASAALKVQKVYRSYRTRRRLADSVVEPDALWWQAIEYAKLNHRTITFFDYSKPESPSSRWNRIVSNASKVGQGLSKHDNAQKLAFLHWIEAIDPRHRYGQSLQFYYEEWVKADSGQPFFYWLDVGDGKHIDLEQCPRSKLRQHSIKYLGPKEREHYEYVFVDGKVIHKLTGTPLTTSKDAVWIYVMSPSKKFYAGEKKKGVFQHSSFLAGGATLASGWLEAEDGVFKTISPLSGHYRPCADVTARFLSMLTEFGINLDEVKVNPAWSPNPNNIQDSES